MKSQKVEIRHILVKSERTAVLRNKNNLWPQVPRPSIKLISRPEMLPHPPLPVRRPQRPPMRHHRLSCPHHIFKAANRIIFNKLQYVLGSVGLLSFYFGGAKLLRFLAKTKHAPRKLSYFVNKHRLEFRIYMAGITSDLAQKSGRFPSLSHTVIPYAYFFMTSQMFFQRKLFLKYWTRMFPTKFWFLIRLQMPLEVFNMPLLVWLQLWSLQKLRL